MTVSMSKFRKGPSLSGVGRMLICLTNYTLFFCHGTTVRCIQLSNLFESWCDARNGTKTVSSLRLCELSFENGILPGKLGYSLSEEGHLVTQITFR